MSEPVVVLNENLEPQGFLIPCPSRITAHLGFDRPTRIPCGLLAGHEGWHRYETSWGEDAGEVTSHDEFRAEDLCRCGHEHLRHDMGHGCIECRCRRFAEAAR